MILLNNYLENIKYESDSSTGTGEESVKHGSYQVIDEAATAEKIRQCESAYQLLIDKLDEKIEKYETLKNDINSKKSEASELSSNFSHGQSLIKNANINADLGDCSECVENLQATLDNLINNCGEEIDKFKEEKENYIREKKNCSTSSANKVYKTVYY